MHTSQKDIINEALEVRMQKVVPKEFQDDGFFSRLPNTENGDWLSEHKEKGQTFSRFRSTKKHCRPHGDVRTIELVVIGPWDENLAPKLKNLTRYTEAFFMGCPVRVAEERVPLKTPGLTESARRGMEGQLQLCCNDIHCFLLGRNLDKEVMCQVAITMVDIYPIKKGIAWNFVFGQARSKDKLGVFSFARYADDFPIWWQPDFNFKAGDYDADSKSQPLEPEAKRRLLKRSCKTLTHEIGHIFGIKHCIEYRCLMNGSNHMQESDVKPLYYCPIDLRKLHLALKFPILERQKKLLALWTEFGWNDGIMWGWQRVENLKKILKE